MGAVVLSRNWPWAQMSDRGCGVGEDGAGEGTPQAHTTSPVGVCPKRLSRDVTMTVRSRLMPNADAHLLVSGPELWWTLLRTERGSCSSPRPHGRISGPLPE